MTVLLSLFIAAAAAVQEPEPASLVVEPSELTLRVGQSAKLAATVKDSEGNVLDRRVLFLPLYGQYWNLEERTWGFNLFRVRPDGTVSASRPGSYKIMVRVPKDPDASGLEDEAFLQQEIPLTVMRPPVERIELVDPPERFYEGTIVRLSTRVTDTIGDLRTDLIPRFESSAPDIARIDSMGYLHAVRPGSVVVSATAETKTASLEIQVADNPVAELVIESSAARARTGDVLHFTARLTDGSGRQLEDVPVVFSFHARTDPLAVGGPSSGLIDQKGRFVADLPGEYTIVATSGSHVDMQTVTIEPRNVRRKVELVGHGRVSDRATSDLWVWQGADGRDYAITGTHSASGHAYIWDVSDPSRLEIIDTVRVDARTVNDVKISEDGRIAVISREGASNRRNGIVILDVSEPSVGVRILSRYDDELTGGVHNVYIYDNHVYALSAGQRYDVISIEDPKNPHRVGKFELPNPDRSIHDVVVHDGIAYSANWNDGVVVVDVGGGGRGGSPRNPVMLGNFPFPTGWNHAVYPYRSRSTGKFYIFAGDEAARTGRFSPEPEMGSGTPGYEGESARWRGWIHILAWEDGQEPELVARYEVPEAGSHNIWVEDDVMYVAFYNGGLRVVDVSGELLGNLYRQQREIAHFLPFDPQGFVPNSPQVWGAQPHKGVIFFSDYNSGLWAVRLAEPKQGHTATEP
ncbi:MAG TPA: hypothetical protein VLK65_02410 [Vicinamibacteria bacterium]|nr:hypothetical protein [Vicinamibacteria bacterium]